MKRLYVDLEKCNSCKDCKVCCEYFYHPQNNGITSLREYATFATLCRHCEDAPCVKACYHDALERASDGHLKRYKMRCTSCKSCNLACPFGVIFQEFIPYLDSKCDYCLGKQGKIPLCVSKCPEHAIEVKEVQEDIAQNIYFVGDYLAVRTIKWSKDDVQPKKNK